MGRAVGLIVMLAVASCYEQPSVCGIACESTCQDGYTCTNHRCVPEDGSACPEQPALLFTSVQPGSFFACGLDNGGSVYCWGDNRFGQIGQTINAIPFPLPTKIGDGFSALSVGAVHACALRDGKAVCWGDNQDGEVQGGTGGTLPPTEVGIPAAAPRFTQITAGGNHSCAIGEDGSLWCWGSAASLGVPNVGMARQIGTDRDWTAVSAGFDHVCGIRTDGVYCFGKNANAQVQLPEGGTVSTPTRIAIGNGEAPLFVSAGSNVSCAVLSSGAGSTTGPLYCWGFNEAHLQIRDTLVNEFLGPTQIGTETDWTSARAGRGVSCGLRSGMAYCWGWALDGGMGNGLWGDRYPYGDPNMRSLGPADEIHFNIGSPANREVSELGCLRTGTTIACWGRNEVGQLGLGMIGVQQTPVEIASPASGHVWTRIRAGREHLCGTTDDNQVWCWGNDGSAEVSAGVDRGSRQPCIASQPCDYPRPTLAPPAAQQATDVICGSAFSCALVGTNMVCWGQNGDGVLGVSGTTGHGPTNVVAPSGSWSSLSGGDRGTCAHVAGSASPACWGRVGQMNYNMPQLLNDGVLQDATMVSVGDDFACAVKDTTRVCWGKNDSGQFGNGNQTTNDTPSIIDNDTSYVSARWSYACRVAASDGSVECAGYNPNGQVGRSPSGAEPNSTGITTMGGLHISGCTRVETGSDHACALCGGQVLCWGEGNNGRRGDGGATIPRQFAGPIEAPGKTFVDLAVYDQGGCAIDTDSKLWCWGDSQHGQVGDGGQDRNLPTPIN